MYAENAPKFGTSRQVGWLLISRFQPIRTHHSGVAGAQEKKNKPKRRGKRGRTRGRRSRDPNLLLASIFVGRKTARSREGVYIGTSLMPRTNQNRGASAARPGLDTIQYWSASLEQGTPTNDSPSERRSRRAAGGRRRYTMAA